MRSNANYMLTKDGTSMKTVVEDLEDLGLILPYSFIRFSDNTHIHFDECQFIDDENKFKEALEEVSRYHVWDIKTDQEVPGVSLQISRIRKCQFYSNSMFILDQI